MVVTESLIKKVSITGFKDLGTINVLLENFKLGEGRIIIECRSRAWAAYWSAMSGDPIEDFFCRCNESYLAGNLSVGIDGEVAAYDALANLARKDVCTRRRDLIINKDKARELFEAADDLECADDFDSANSGMSAVFGPEWWHLVPDKPNPDYVHLCNIIRAVQTGLASLKQDANPS